LCRNDRTFLEELTISDIIDQIEAEVLEAIVRADVALLERLLHPAFTYIHSNGHLETRDDLVNVIGTGARVWSKAVAERVSRVDHRDLAATLSRVRVGLVYEGRDYQTQLVLTAVYAKKDGGRVVAWHGWHA